MKVFTTGQVGKICKVSPRTVAKWFDERGLKGYRIPNSQDRRIPRQYLIPYLKAHGIPLGELEDSHVRKVAVISENLKLRGELKRRMTPENGFRLQLFRSTFSAGSYASESLTDCYLLDFSLGISPATRAAISIRKNSLNPRAAIIALTVFPLIDPPRGVFTENVPLPFDPAYLVERVCSLVPLDT